MAEPTKLQYRISNGNWVDCATDGKAEIEKCQALKFNAAAADGRIVYAHQPEAVRPLTSEELETALLSGLVIETGSDWYSQIRSGAVIDAWQELHPPIEPKMVLCACGHTVSRGEVMVASLGTACPDCYDEMS